MLKQKPCDAAFKVKEILRDVGDIEDCSDEELRGKDCKGCQFAALGAAEAARRAIVWWLRHWSNRRKLSMLCTSGVYAINAQRWRKKRKKRNFEMRVHEMVS